MREGRTEPPNANQTGDAATGRPTGPGARRATVSEAAGELGISAEAVRSRVKRGTLKSTKEGGTVYVLLPAPARPDHDQTLPEHDRAYDGAATEHDRTGDRTPLVEALEDQVSYLREQLAEEREARRRADMLLARLAEANATMAGQIRELMPAEGPRESPEPPAERPEGTAETRPDTTEPQTGAQEPEGAARRPWWLRWLGG